MACKPPIFIFEQMLEILCRFNILSTRCAEINTACWIQSWKSSRDVTSSIELVDWITIDIWPCSVEVFGLLLITLHTTKSIVNSKIFATTGGGCRDKDSTLGS